MKKTLTTYLFVLGLATFLSVGSSVMAQQVPEPVKNNEVVARVSVEEEIEKIRATYRGQLTEYRDAEKEFVIAKDQYKQLQTLASINKVTEAARKVFMLRDQVLITYLNLQRSNIYAAEGIELSLKELVISRIEQEGRWLVDHKNRVEKMLDRTQFNALADEFTTKEDDFIEVTSQATMILALGGLQDVHDRLVLARAEIFELEAKSSTADRTRASKETDRWITQVKDLLAKTWVELGDDVKDNKVMSFASNSVKTLEPIYAGLNKTVSFLEELLREQ
ncbi:MAG: hypothetical protein IT416_04085 [Candidatus Pacebacteria bacterium]|nr:hypothetical protein [Candidatus Paceibacterota bacterium]